MRSPTSKYSFHKWRNDHGGAMVEFAIVLPFLLLLVGGIIEFGFLFYNKQVITNASREGARAGIVFQENSSGEIVTTETDVQALVSNYCADKLINFGENESISTFARNAEDPNTLVEDLNFPQHLKVTVIFTHTFLLSSFLSLSGLDVGPTFPISASTVMKME